MKLITSNLPNFCLSVIPQDFIKAADLPEKRFYFKNAFSFLIYLSSSEYFLALFISHTVFLIGELCCPRLKVWEGSFMWQFTYSRIFPNVLPILHCWFLYYSCMNFCYYSTPFSSHGKCISVFGTSSPSFLGNMKMIESIRWFFFFQLAYLFHRKLPLLNSICRT